MKLPGNESNILKSKIPYILLYFWQTDLLESQLNTIHGALNYFTKYQRGERKPPSLTALTTLAWPITFKMRCSSEMKRSLAIVSWLLSLRLFSTGMHKRNVREQSIFDQCTEFT